MRIKFPKNHLPLSSPASAPPLCTGPYYSTNSHGLGLVCSLSDKALELELTECARKQPLQTDDEALGLQKELKVYYYYYSTMQINAHK
jgi:hypothetical protein